MRPDVIAWRTEHWRYFDLLHQKWSQYWTTSINSEWLQPHHLWQSTEWLLGCSQAPTVTDTDASVLHHFFNDKVAGVWDATAGAPAVSSDSFSPSHRQMSSNQFRHSQTSSASQILCRCGCWKLMLAIRLCFLVSFSTNHFSMELFHWGCSLPALHRHSRKQAWIQLTQNPISHSQTWQYCRNCCSDLCPNSF